MIQTSAAPQKFVLARRVIVGGLITWLLLFAFAAVFVFVAFRARYVVPGGWLVQAASILWIVLVTVGGYRVWYLSGLSVVVSKEGVTQRHLDRVTAFLPWKEVRLIRELRAPTSFRGKGYYYELVGDTAKVRVTNGMEDVDVLFATIVSRASEHHIPIVGRT